MIAKDPTTGAELVMPDTRAEYDALKKRLGLRPDNCCITAGPVQHWPLFESCGGGNGPGHLILPHCTCDHCF